MNSCIIEHLLWVMVLKRASSGIHVSTIFYFCNPKQSALVETHFLLLRNGMNDNTYPIWVLWGYDEMVQLEQGKIKHSLPVSSNYMPSRGFLLVHKRDMVPALERLTF